ncbi:hypothetical protein VNI00_009454 [Paramarasmius palmivorus]|uniref:Uncharacterized protein n=1 Tax=Paramarasmius palmivorus TaxID=297713 RepID=A0AAW0CRF5_9AGAR
MSTIALAAPSVKPRQDIDSPFKDLPLYPAKCKAQCDSTDADFFSCTNSGKSEDVCLCNNSLLSRVATCYGCIATETKEPVDKYQGIMDITTGACNTVGIKVDSQKISLASESSSASTTNGATSATSSGGASQSGGASATSSGASESGGASATSSGAASPSGGSSTTSTEAAPDSSSSAESKKSGALKHYAPLKLTALGMGMGFLVLVA